MDITSPAGKDGESVTVEGKTFVAAGGSLGDDLCAFDTGVDGSL